MTLAEAIARFPKGNAMWYSEDQEILPEDIFAAEKQFQEQHPSLAGRAVAAACSNSFTLGITLAALDGFAQQILLLPSQTGCEEANVFIARAGVEAIVGDRTGFSLPSISPPALPTSRSNANSTIEFPHPSLKSEWIIPTSGTTGTPKLVAHTLASLTRTLKTDIEKGSRYRWGLLYDLARFAGIQVFLQSLFGGSRLIFADQRAGLISAIDTLSRQSCNALSGTPTLWRKLTMTGRLPELPLEIISLGGEIADQALLSVLRRTFPNSRITHIYASTEAGVGFSVVDGEAGFPAHYLTTPPTGVEMRVDEQGFLWLRPANRDQHYLGEMGAISGDDGWINTGDLVEKRNDRYYFLGRANGAINVGGNKVHPAEVEQTVLQVPGVVGAVVRPKRSAFMGNLVEALIVSDGVFPDAELAASVQQHCQARLEPFKVPALVRVVDTLETTAAGKAVR